MATDLNDLLGIDPDDPRTAEIEADRADYRRLVQNLVAQRQQATLTQKQVADLMETSQSVVSAFEQAVTDPRFSTVQRYARAVGSRVRWVYPVTSGAHVEQFAVRANPGAAEEFYRTAAANA